MDIRLTRGRNQRVWLWTALLVGLGGVAIAAAAIFGDPTAHGRMGGVGAAAHFGSDRAPVLPVVVEAFQNTPSLTDRELGRLLYVTGTAESAVRRNAVFVRSADGRRILVRFEPAPSPAKLAQAVNGGGISVNGYLQKISRAEFNVWMDTLGVVVPRPAPGVKFGDLPDPNFMRVDSLFVKDFYISVRPEGINPTNVPPVRPAAADQAEPQADASADSSSAVKIDTTRPSAAALQVAPVTQAPANPADTVRP